MDGRRELKATAWFAGLSPIRELKPSFIEKQGDAIKLYPIRLG